MDAPTPFVPPPPPDYLLERATAPFTPPAALSPALHPAITPPNPTPSVPAPTTLDDPATTARDMVARSVVEVFHRIDLPAYLEAIARTDPKVFQKYVAMLAPAGGSKGPAVQVNVNSMIGRSPLDGLPPGFDAHR